MLRSVIEAAKTAGIPVLVDPGPKANFTDYRGATAVTPNRLETKLATGLEVLSAADAFVAGQQLVETLQLEHAFVTLDKDGISLALNDGSAELFATRKREVYDITGAGDMVLAMIGVGMADGLSPQDLCRLANVAGGLEVERIGVVAITRQEILGDLLGGSRKVHEKISDLNELARLVDARKQLGQKVVFTNGCYDLLHAGHVQYLQEAATLGDCLIVALNSDDSTRRLKGPTRPVISEQQRSMMLAALECVDHAVVFDEDTPLRCSNDCDQTSSSKGAQRRSSSAANWSRATAAKSASCPKSRTFPPLASSRRFARCAMRLDERMGRPARRTSNFTSTISNLKRDL